MKKRKALKTASVIVLVCALIFVAFEIFRVRYITVSGCETVSAKDVVALSGIKTGELVFEIDTNKAMEAIGAAIDIKPVSIVIEYPNSVKITVEERKEAACIQESGTFLIIDDEGWLLKITNGSVAQYPMVTGLSLGDYNVGEKLGASDAFQLDVLSEVLKETESTGTAVKNVDVSIASDVVIELNNGFKAELGDDTNLDQKFKLMKSSVDKLQGMGKTGGIIDVASGTTAYYREK